MNTYKVYWVEYHRTEVDAIDEEDALEKALEIDRDLTQMRPVISSDAEIDLVYEDPIDKKEREQDAYFGQ